MAASPEIISPPERVVLGLFAPIALAVGGIAGGILAGALDGKTLTSDYWDKLLTITGVSALPLVAVAVLVIRARLTERRTNPVAFWGGSILLGGMVAFIVVLVVIMICLYEMVTTPEAGKVAGSLPLWVATLGAGLTLGAVAASVAAAALDKIDDPPAGRG
jgi:MFS-type transporter involved in bile tolerance (Atg22 family)